MAQLGKARWWQCVCKDNGPPLIAYSKAEAVRSIAICSYRCIPTAFAIQRIEYRFSQRFIRGELATSASGSKRRCMQRAPSTDVQWIHIADPSPLVRSSRYPTCSASLFAAPYRGDTRTELTIRPPVLNTSTYRFVHVPNTFIERTLACQTLGNLVSIQKKVFHQRL